MQKRSKEIIISNRSEIKTLLAEAIAHHNQSESARKSVKLAVEHSIWHAWLTGVALNKMKALVGFGDWLDWLDLNFCEPRGLSRDTAQRYMRIDAQNETLREKVNTARLRQGEPDLELVRKLKFDTRRKFSISFVPEKTRPDHGGKDIKFQRLVHPMTLINEFEKVKRQIETSDNKIDFKSLWRDLEPLHQWLEEIKSKAGQ